MQITRNLAPATATDPLDPMLQLGLYHNPPPMPKVKLLHWISPTTGAPNTQQQPGTWEIIIDETTGEWLGALPVATDYNAQDSGPDPWTQDRHFTKTMTGKTVMSATQAYLRQDNGCAACRKSPRQCSACRNYPSRQAGVCWECGARVAAHKNLYCSQCQAVKTAATKPCRFCRHDQPCPACRRYPNRHPSECVRCYEAAAPNRTHCESCLATTYPMQRKLKCNACRVVRDQGRRRLIPCSGCKRDRTRIPGRCRRCKSAMPTTAHNWLLCRNCRH